MGVERFQDNPIIYANMQGRIGSNINGPSLIRIPDWVSQPLGRYYLYFAHHKGKFIRLAYADELQGPWEIYEPGTLKVGESCCRDHLASPDVHVNSDNRQIRMYYHGVSEQEYQVTKIAVSNDGIKFHCFDEVLGHSYFRVFYWRNYYYALGMPGVFYRSKDGITGFEKGPTLFSRNMRHSALKLDGNVLSVFYSDVGDIPEHVKMATIDISGEWMKWKESEAVTILKPEIDYEGVGLSLEPSVRDWAPHQVRQLRDPAIYREGDDTYLLYSVAGESGIAIARLSL